MRMRKKPWAASELASNPRVMDDYKALKGKWKEYFGNHNPVFVEIGSGKGRFIRESAGAITDNRICQV